MQDLKSNICKIALVQGEPVLFDKEKTMKKVLDYVEEAAGNGAQLIVFPESFVPCYPYGMSFGFSVGARTQEGREDWKRYYDNSMVVPGEETELLGQAAEKYRVYISIGITERDAVNATLYCTNLIFSPDGKLAAKHRKLKPTGAERYIWGDGYEGHFPVVETPWGVMGSLICWENYMPLARVALYEKGTAIYLAPNTNDNPEWFDTIRHIAIEGHCYVVNVDQYVRRESYPKDLNAQDEIGKLPETIMRGGSCVVDPYGHYVNEPVWDREGIIYADLDMEAVPSSRMEFDGVGHYSRPDVLELRVNDSRD